MDPPQNGAPPMYKTPSPDVQNAVARLQPGSDAGLEEFHACARDVERDDHPNLTQPLESRGNHRHLDRHPGHNRQVVRASGSEERDSVEGHDDETNRDQQDTDDDRDGDGAA